MNEDKKRLLAEVERIAREVAGALGLEIVEFVFHSQGRHSLLRIDLDRPGIPGVGLADCEEFSRTLGDRIEEISFFESPYDLQVSSPGIDRPIVTDDDIRRNAGRPVWLEHRDETGRLRELRGTLAGLEGPDTVAITAGRDPIHVPRQSIVHMKQDVALGGGKRNRP